MFDSFTKRPPNCVLLLSQCQNSDGTWVITELSQYLSSTSSSEWFSDFFGLDFVSQATYKLPYLPGGGFWAWVQLLKRTADNTRGWKKSPNSSAFSCFYLQTILLKKEKPSPSLVKPNLRPCVMKVHYRSRLLVWIHDLKKMRYVPQTLLLSPQDAPEECRFKRKDIAAQSRAAAARKPQNVHIFSFQWKFLHCTQNVKKITFFSRIERHFTRNVKSTFQPTRALLFGLPAAFVLKWC